MTQYIRHLTAVAALLISGSCLAVANPEHFPRPAAIEPAVQFWTRVFSEVGTKGGFIHDDRYLDVIYEVIKLPNTNSRRTKQKYVNKVKKRYIAILKKLATGKRKGLSKEAQRVLKLWPNNVSNKTLRSAVNRIRFQLGQADKYKEGLIRSGAWKPHILQNLKKMGLPKEIASLPHVESSFNPKAYSRVGAAGLWQFTRSTGRRFMRIDHIVDERMDPFKASVAAARLLENNYAVTGTWPLALTAYNHGAAGMRNAARQTGTTDIDVIIKKYRSRSFKFASRNFYTAFLAAVDVEQDAEKYFGPVTQNPEIKDGLVSMPAFMDAQTAAEALGVSTKYLKRKNPALRAAVWNSNKYIPRGFKLRYDKSKVKTDASQALANIAAGKMYAKQKPDLYHRIRRGQTLSTIAARYGVKVSDIVALNNLRSRHRIRSGQVIRLPQPGGKRARMVASKRKAKKYPLPLPSDGKIKVKRGDTVTRIAKRYGLTNKKIIAYNNLNRRGTIYPGQLLSIKPKPAKPKPAKPKPKVIVASATEAVVKIKEPAPVVLAGAAKTIANGSVTDNTTADSTIMDGSVANLSETNVPGASITVKNNSATDTTTAEKIDNSALIREIEIIDEPEAVALLESKQHIIDEADKRKAVANTETVINDDGADEQPMVEQILPTEASQLDNSDSENPPTEESTEEELPADPSDYSVAKNNTIEVQAAETLGHYAEWLGIRASKLRRINKMRYGKPVVIGKRIKLSFKKVSHEDFEHQRKEYHRILQEAFFEQFQITGNDKHKIRRGDSIWILAKRKYNVPIWLLRQYNPDVTFQKVLPGVVITFPKVEQRRLNDPAANESGQKPGQSMVSKRN